MARFAKFDFYNFAAAIELVGGSWIKSGLQVALMKMRSRVKLCSSLLAILT
jgi:hypothetical protein